MNSQAQPNQDNTWPSSEEATALSVRDLALRILARLASEHDDLVSQQNFVGQQAIAAGQPSGLAPYQRVIINGPKDAMDSHRELTAALDEAWAWLVQHGLLAGTSRWAPGDGTGAFFVTHLGHEVVAGRRTI
jgi:hypothetical protein